jgi:hypothetical protein
LKPGGRIIHINPSLGCSNHGMFNFQPTFYFSYYSANSFKSLKCDLLEIFTTTSNLFIDKDAIARVIPISNFNNLEIYSSNPVYNIFFAQKPENFSISEIKMPVQEFYYRIFKEKEKANGGMIDMEKYNDIVGKTPENSNDIILKNSYYL